MPKIITKRGKSSNITTTPLDQGELAYTLDTNKLYMGLGGTSKQIINNIDPPTGINSTNFYTKVRVNAFGQVVSQTLLTAADIPPLNTSKITDIGTAAQYTVGNSSGNIPILDTYGKFPVSTIPAIPVTIPSASYMYVYTTDSVTTGMGGAVLFQASTGNGGAILYTPTEGSISITKPGRYLISYHITTSASSISMALINSPNTAMYTGSKASMTTPNSSPLSISATLIKVYSTPEKFILRNMGTTAVTCLDTSCGMTVVELL